MANIIKGVNKSKDKFLARATPGQKFEVQRLQGWKNELIGRARHREGGSSIGVGLRATERYDMQTGTWIKLIG